MPAPADEPLAGADLTQMITAGATIHDIAAFLDALTHDQRLAQVRSTPRRVQARLYELAADSEPLDLAFFVPQDLPPGVHVVHHGWNSLPLPAFGRRFQKPMARCPDKSGKLFGYNVSPFGPLIGPGYFLHTTTDHEPDWPDRGHTVVDYFQVPDHAVPSDWPRVVPNSRGLQVFVYNKTRDFMRRVSQHVSVGAAYKGSKRLGAYFILVREDA